MNGSSREEENGSGFSGWLEQSWRFEWVSNSTLRLQGVNTSKQFFFLLYPLNKARLRNEFKFFSEILEAGLLYYV